MLQLAAHVSAPSALESACGVLPSLELLDGQPPASCAVPNAAAPIWQVTLPAGWKQAAERGVLCQFDPPPGWQGHWRVRDAGGVCCVQGAAAVGADSTADMVLLIQPLNTLLTITFG